MPDRTWVPQHPATAWDRLAPYRGDTTVHTPTPRVVHPWIEWIADPRAVSALCAAAWAAITAAGIAALALGPPSSIASELGPYLTIAWAGLYLTGGLLAMVGALPGWWYLERAGIILLVVGLVVYDGVVWALHLTAGGNRAPQGLIVGALVLLSLARFARISGPALDPARGPGAPAPPPVPALDDDPHATH